MIREKSVREANARELSLRTDARTWYLLVEGTDRHYPYSLADKYELALELLTKLE